MNRNISLGILAVVLLGLLQAGLRLYFALATSGALGLELQDQVHSMIATPMSDAFWTMNAAMFSILGVAGVATSFGLALGKTWGLYGTVAFSVLTIAFDVWAMVAVQFTAVFGLVLPAVFIVYLVLRKDRVLAPKAVTA